jgi:hypothetical protein
VPVSPSSAKFLGEGDIAPAFRLAEYGDTGYYDLYENLRDHPVVVAFVSMPCIPCEQSFPAMTKLCDWHQESHEIEIVSIALSNERSIKRCLDLESFSCDVKVLLEDIEKGSYLTSEKYGVLGTPVFFLVGKSGEILWRHIGRLTVENVENKIKQVMTQMNK